MQRAQSGPGAGAQGLLAVLAALVAIGGLPAPGRTEAALPLEIRSERSDGALRARIGGTIDRPLDTVAAVLAEPVHWCQFVPIDPTVRSCTWREVSEDAAVLTLFGGSEKTLMPDTAFELPYHFEVLLRSADALEVLMHADEGPSGTRDYRMRLRATRAGADRTRLEAITSFAMSPALETLMKSYLETLGRDKMGFSVVGRDGAGKPRYVRGVQGLIERGAMRHYLALRAYLDSLDVAPDERFEASLERWWELSQVHPQLEEASRAEYLAKQRRGVRLAGSDPLSP